MIHWVLQWHMIGIKSEIFIKAFICEKGFHISLSATCRHEGGRGVSSYFTYDSSTNWRKNAWCSCKIEFSFVSVVTVVNQGGGSRRRVHRTSARMNVLLAMNHKYNSSIEVLWSKTTCHLVSVWSAMWESANKMCLREVKRSFIVGHYCNMTAHSLQFRPSAVFFLPTYHSTLVLLDVLYLVTKNMYRSNLPHF